MPSARGQAHLRSPHCLSGSSERTAQEASLSVPLLLPFPRRPEKRCLLAFGQTRRAGPEGNCSAPGLPLERVISGSRHTGGPLRRASLQQEDRTHQGAAWCPYEGAPAGTTSFRMCWNLVFTARKQSNILGSKCLPLPSAIIAVTSSSGWAGR